MTNCPNCGAILPINLTSEGTVKCEYCGGFVAVGAIDFEQTKPENHLTAFELVKKISDASRAAGINLKEVIK